VVLPLYFFCISVRTLLALLAECLLLYDKMMAVRMCDVAFFIKANSSKEQKR
jgi:hypothetical protein